jgi:uncharacterized membrane protein
MELFVIFVLLLLSFIVIPIARKRGRSGFGWFLLSLIISPIVTMIILFVLGDTEEKRREKRKESIEEEERFRKEIRDRSM